MVNLPDEDCFDDYDEDEETVEKQYYFAKFKESDEFIINEYDLFYPFRDFINDPEIITETTACELLNVSSSDQFHTALNFYPGLLFRVLSEEAVRMFYTKKMFEIDEIKIDGDWLECIKGNILFSFENEMYYSSHYCCNIYKFLYFTNTVMDMFSGISTKYSRQSGYTYAIFALDQDMTSRVEIVTKKIETSFNRYIKKFIESNPEKACTVEDYCKVVEDYERTLKKYTPLQIYYLGKITEYDRSGHYKNPFSRIGIESLERFADRMECQQTQEHVSVLIVSEALSCVLQKKYSIPKIRDMAKKGELVSIRSDKIYIELDSLFKYILEHSGIRFTTAGQLATYMRNAQKRK